VGRIAGARARGATRQAMHEIPGRNGEAWASRGQRFNLAFHFAVWWVIAAVPCLFAHDQPLAALLAPAMPALLVGWVAHELATGEVQNLLLGLSIPCVIAPVAWTLAWRRPGRPWRLLLAHLGILAWWAGGIMALGMSL
jgi:hypothetical protein